MIDTSKHEKIKALLANKVPYNQICAIVGCSKGTISYHAARIGIGVRIRRYNWNEIRKYYDTGKSMYDCITRFGFSKGTWDRAVKCGYIVVRDRKVPLGLMLVANSPYSDSGLRSRVLQSGLIKQTCYSCGLNDIWNDKPIQLWLDHANGDDNDWRIENLRMVCPNCDSQSETFAGRNVKRKNKQAASISAMH